MMQQMTLRGIVELRKFLKSCFKTVFHPWSQQTKCLCLYRGENSGAVKTVCTVTPQGCVWHYVRRITGSNGQCSTLMKSPDEEADWSPSTDQPLPFPFSWVPRCIAGGISRLRADPCGLNMFLHTLNSICMCGYTQQKVQCCLNSQRVDFNTFSEFM